ncbi:hypothetical protein FRC09_015868 [Ceratobasidium sp. 395]|nr:hypothetical protein FRC09_015868 [Ceratobasidium sp. 395]
MVLVSDREIDGYWSNFIKSVVSFAETLAYCKASKLLAERFTNEYYTWLNTLTFVRRQVLNNPGGDESLRANAPGAEIAWMSVGKVFDFTTHTRTDDASQEPVRANGYVRKQDIAVVCARIHTGAWRLMMLTGISVHWKGKFFPIEYVGHR